MCNAEAAPSLLAWGRARGNGPNPLKLLSFRRIGKSRSYKNKCKLFIFN